MMLLLLCFFKRKQAVFFIMREKILASSLQYCWTNSSDSVASVKPVLTASSHDISKNLSGLDHALWAICLNVPPDPIGQVNKPSLGDNGPISAKWMVVSVECRNAYITSTMARADFIRLGTASKLMGTAEVSTPLTMASTDFGATFCLLRGGMGPTQGSKQPSPNLATAKNPVEFEESELQTESWSILHKPD